MQLWRDLRNAWRRLRQAPGYALTVVLTLGIGIGASAAIFCLMDGLWLHPMNVPNSGALVRIFGTTPQDPNGAFNYSEYQVIASRATAFQGDHAGVVAIGGRGSLMPNPDGTSTLLLNNVVSDNFFTVLGIRPLLGRTFSAADAAQLRTHPAMLLGYSAWKRHFAADPNIVGRMIPLRRGADRIVQVQVWGVLPKTFRDVDPNSDRDLWIPVDTWAAFGGEKELTASSFRWFNLVARLAPGSSVAKANQQVASITGAIAAADPKDNAGRGARVVSDLKYRMANAGTTGMVLFAIVGCVVLLAIVNVAQIMLAKAIARSPEVALRMALGAKRGRIIRELLCETLLLGSASLMVAMGIAAGVAALLPHLVNDQPEMLNQLAAGPGFAVDWRVFSFAALLSIVTLLLLALVPIAQTARVELLPVLQSASTTRTESRAPIARRAAIWLQIGIAFAVLISTGALVRSFLNTQTHSIGVTRQQVLVAFTQDPDEPLRDQLLARLRAIPGVEDGAYGIRSPLMPSEGGMAAKVTLPSHPEIHDPLEIKYNAVSPGFLRVVGTRVLYGRGFEAADNAGGPPVVLISQAMARRFWPAQNPIGQTVKMPGFNGGKDLDARIVGVTEDAPINQVGEIPEPYMYVPFRFFNEGEVTFVLRSHQNAMSIAREARQALIGVNPLLDPMFITSLPELIRSSTGSYRMTAELVSALGLIGLVLTIVGLYGFVAFRVAQRRREIGIRMALGASRRAAARLVLLDAARLLLAGLALGLLLAVLAGRLEASVLFGVHALNTLSVIAAAAVISAAALAAALVPARRAASLEPMQALRTE